MLKWGKYTKKKIGFMKAADTYSKKLKDYSPKGKGKYNKNMKVDIICIELTNESKSLMCIYTLLSSSGGALHFKENVLSDGFFAKVLESHHSSLEF